MAWPDHTMAGSVPPISAATYVEDIIAVCSARLAGPEMGEILRRYHQMILGHAYLERENHAHGMLRNFVLQNGNATQPMPNSLDIAWTQVRDCYQNLVQGGLDPGMLQLSLDGINHGGGGGPIGL